MSAIRRARVDKGWSAGTLAEKSGISVEQIRNIESGRTRNPRAETLHKLAKVLRVKPSEIDPMLQEEASVT